MTREEIEQAFEDFSEDFLKSENIDFRFGTKRRDLHAFIILDRLVPGPNKYGNFVDMVAGAAHDEIFLDVGFDDLEKSGIEISDIIELIRCGVRVDEYGESLAMFV